MFTGIVEITGKIHSIRVRGGGKLIGIETTWNEEAPEIGASIAVNGCCLTVVQCDQGMFEFEVGEETLSRTNLGQLKPEQPVNLERAMAIGDRFDGHVVTGHIDGPGTVVQREDDEEWSRFWIEVPQNLTRQMAAKGSVTVDGVSLTLVDVERDRFSVALIPHTLKITTLGQRRAGDQVNIETDVLAKYIERQLQFLNQAE